MLYAWISFLSHSSRHFPEKNLVIIHIISTNNAACKDEC